MGSQCCFNAVSELAIEFCVPKFCRHQVVKGGWGFADASVGGTRYSARNCRAE
jgi:hypothetical protein